jgi:RecB family exonuclease
MFERNPLYPTLDEVISFYTEHFHEKTEKIEWSDPDKKEAEEKMYFEEGIKLLTNFYKKNQPWTFNVVELEGRFSLELLDELTGKVHTLVGIIDRLDKDPESDVYEIIDYKTGKRMPSEAELADNLQLGVYHLALTSRWPSVEPERFVTSLYFLKHNEKVSVNPTRDTLARTRALVLKTIREIEGNIEKNDFPPMPGPLCGWCAYQRFCPMWAHEYKEEATKTASDAEVAQAIQDFFELKQQGDEVKDALEGARSTILSYMESEEVARVFGERGYITKNVQERVSYNLEKLEDVLKEAGVWEKILEPESKKLEEFLPSLAIEVIEALQAQTSKKQVVVLKPTKKKGMDDEEE